MIYSVNAFHALLDGGRAERFSKVVDGMTSNANSACTLPMYISDDCLTILDRLDAVSLLIVLRYFKSNGDLVGYQLPMYIMHGNLLYP